MSKNIHDELRAGINHFLDDSHAVYLTRKLVRVYGDGDWLSINQSLLDWQQRSLLKIIKTPQDAADDEVCIQMLAYIDRKSPWPDWP
jgi:hypothetical protein